MKFCVHQSPPLVPYKSINPAHTLKAYFFNYLITNLPSTARSSKWSLFLSFPHNYPECTCLHLSTCHSTKN